MLLLQQNMPSQNFSYHVAWTWPNQWKGTQGNSVQLVVLCLFMLTYTVVDLCRVLTELCGRESVDGDWARFSSINELTSLQVRHSTRLL